MVRGHRGRLGLVPVLLLVVGYARASPPALYRDATVEEQTRLTSVVLPLLQAAQITVPPGSVVRLGIRGHATGLRSLAPRVGAGSDDPGCHSIPRRSQMGTLTTSARSPPRRT